MKWIKADELAPVDGRTLYIKGELIDSSGQYVKGLDCFYGNQSKDYIDKKFVYWLDEAESPSLDQQQGDGWMTEKPSGFKDDCILLTASLIKNDWHTNKFEILKTDGEDDDGKSGWYWGIYLDDSEWGDYDDLKADKYKIIEFPKPQTP